MVVSSIGEVWQLFNLFNNKIDDLILLWVVELAHPMVERWWTWQYQTLLFVSMAMAQSSGY
jgi:hypothetical protein